VIEDIQQRSMPESVREPFEVLWQEVVQLHFRWKVFKQLYFNTRVVELLNKHASGFFGLDQRIWIESIVLGLSRVLDDTKGSTSLRVLVKRMSTAGPHELAAELEQRLSELVTISEVMLEAHRDGRIAHLDAKFHPSGGKEDLPPLEIPKIEQLFTGIAKLMNAVGVGVGHGTTLYSAADALSDGDSIVFALRKADRFDELFDFAARWDELDKGRFKDLSKRYWAEGNPPEPEIP